MPNWENQLRNVRTVWDTPASAASIEIPVALDGFVDDVEVSSGMAGSGEPEEAHYTLYQLLFISLQTAAENVPLVLVVTVKARSGYWRWRAACSDVSGLKPTAPLIASQSSNTLRWLEAEDVTTVNCSESDMLG